MAYSQRNKFIQEGLIPDGEYNPIINTWNSGPGSLTEFLFRPFYEKVDKTPYTQVGFTAGLWLALLTVIGAFLNGLVFSLVAIEQDGSTDPLRGVVVALVGAIFFIAPMLWTMDTDLRVHTKPGIQLALIGTFDLGAVIAVIFAGIQLLGYAVAGWVTVALVGNADSVLDDMTGIANPAAMRLMAYMATSVVAFVYIYNQRFHNVGEKENENQSRVLMVTALFEFGFRLAFYQYGLKTFNSGLHVAGGIINSYIYDLTPGDGFGDNVFFALVPLFAAPGTAVLLFYLASFLIGLKDRTIRTDFEYSTMRKRRPRRREIFGGPASDEYADDNMMGAKVSTQSAMQARTTRRNLDTTF
jgi:hypothetical protein